MTPKKATLAAALTLFTATLVSTSSLAHGARVRVVVPHHHRPAYVLGVVPYRQQVVRVERINFGTVDFNVVPQRSRIYIDGDYLGIADDFNGYPQKARLRSGYHIVRVVSPDGQVEVRRIWVAAGRELNFNLKF